MIKLKYLEERDFQKIVDWNYNKSEEYLFQWAGPGYEYPITVEQIKKRFEKEKVNQVNSNTYIYKILNHMNELIGTVELSRINREEKTAIVGRFLIGEENLRGKGYGKQALKALVELAFDSFLLDKVLLRVFDFNKGAIKCYEDVGFVKEEFHEKVKELADGSFWGGYVMGIEKHKAC